MGFLHEELLGKLTVLRTHMIFNRMYNTCIYSRFCLILVVGEVIVIYCFNYIIVYNLLFCSMTYIQGYDDVCLSMSKNDIH